METKSKSKSIEGDKIMFGNMKKKMEDAEGEDELVETLTKIKEEIGMVKEISNIDWN